MLFLIGDDDSAELTLPVVTYALIALNVLFFGLSTPASSKYRYILGNEHPLKFFNSRRSIASVLSRHVHLKEQFRLKFGDQYRTVSDYFRPRKNLVAIEDVSPWPPDLVGEDSRF